MHKHTSPSGTGILAIIALWLAFAAPPASAGTLSGEAVAVRANVHAVTTLLGTLPPAINTALADTGSLTNDTDMRQASMLSGGVSSLLSGQTLHAFTAGAPDGVTSEASLSGLSLSLAGNNIGAGFVMARALAATGGAASASSEIDTLQVNGTLVTVTGATNEVIPLLGGRIVLNEQQLTSDGTMVVNAIHITISGVADVVIASASAGAGSSSSGTLPNLPLLGMTTSDAYQASAAWLAYRRGPACVQSKRLPEIV